MSQDYYVYTLAYPDGTVFYVGKGRGERIHIHENEAQKSTASQKCAIIRAIWEQGGQVLKKKIYTHLSEEDALAVESILIALFDRATLANGHGGQKNVLPIPPKRVYPLNGGPRQMSEEDHRKRSAIAKQGWQKRRERQAWIEKDLQSRSIF